MSSILDEAVTLLAAKLSGGVPGRVKFVIAGEGAVMADATGVHAGDEEADVTLTADAETFQGMLSGEINPTSAFMTGRLSVDGDMGLAMQLGSALA